VGYLIGKATLVVYQVKRSNTVGFSYAEIVCSIRRCQVNNTGTVFGSDKITQDHPKSIAFFRLFVRQELLIAQTFQATAFKLIDNFVRNVFAVIFVVIKR